MQQARCTLHAAGPMMHAAGRSSVGLLHGTSAVAKHQPGPCRAEATASQRMPKRDDVWRRKCGTQKYGIQRTTQDRQHMPTRKLTTYDRQHTELQQEARRLWQRKRGKVDVKGQPPRLGEHRCRRGVAAGKGRFARCNHRISNGSTREQSARAAAAALPRVLCSN